MKPERFHLAIHPRKARRIHLSPNVWSWDSQSMKGNKGCAVSAHRRSFLLSIKQGKLSKAVQFIAAAVFLSRASNDKQVCLLHPKHKTNIVMCILYTCMWIVYEGLTWTTSGFIEMVTASSQNSGAKGSPNTSSTWTTCEISSGWVPNQ